MKACVSLNSSVPIGTMAAYGLTALVIWMSAGGMFVLAGAALIGTSLFWITGMKRVERYAAESGKMTEMSSGETGGSAKAAVNWKSLLIQSGFLFLMMASLSRGR